MKNIIHVEIIVLKCVNLPMPVVPRAGPDASAAKDSIEIKKEFVSLKM